MIEYVKQLAKDISEYPKKKPPVNIFSMFRALAEELDRLDPRDFLPDAQYEFVVVRLRARSYANKTHLNESPRELSPVQDMCTHVIEVLGKYGGDGSRAITRDFTFVNDPDLKAIIERDYRELNLLLFPSAAWKSVVIMAGSILEAILYDALTKDSTTLTKAKQSGKAPSGKDITKDEWTLQKLIEVAVDIGVLPSTRGDSIDQVLRDYRNFVHPQKEIKSAHPCTEAEGYMAKGALDGVCNHLQP